jgi:GNAT superfamily N-acetyltransferase
MWTAPSERRRGHARRVLAALEDAARARGYRAVRLETGRPQPEAVALYAGAGYAPITPYGR